MRKLIILTFICINFIYGEAIAQEDSTLSLQQIEEYEIQTRQMVKYLEGTLNFIGDPDELPAEKDIIFRESYLKLFTSDQVQIEDDLDENREQPLNKDVQAYLKDIDFFFKEVSFNLEIDTTEQIITDSNQVVFKVTVNRFIEGITVNNDTIRNNQLRFVEINLDPLQRDLKIASIYTTKIREKEEIRNWWNNMSSEWKSYFGSSVIVYDSIPFSNIVWFSDTSIVALNWIAEVSMDTIKMVDDPNIDPLFPADSIIINYDTVERIVPDTIITNTSTVYRLLSAFRRNTKVDISNNLSISSLEPLAEVNGLIEINISNTLISDLKPLRNLKNLETIDCSGSAVTDLSPIRYLSSLFKLNIEKTNVSELTQISGLTGIGKLNLSRTRVIDTKPILGLINITQLNLSHTDIHSLDGLNRLANLSDLNIAASDISDLIGIDSLRNIQHLNIDSTKIADLYPIRHYDNISVLQANNTNLNSLEPLNNKPGLKIIYCDNTNVKMDEANRFMDKNPGTLVIYNSEELVSWWRGLSSTWKIIFKESYGIKDPVTIENLHQIILKKELRVAYNEQLSDLRPIWIMHRLEKLELQNTSISDLSTLSGLPNLEEINLSNTPVLTIEPLSSLRNIGIIYFENTQVDDLEPLVNSIPEIIYCDNSQVQEEDAISFMNLYPATLIVFQSQTLNMWWNDLDNIWKDEFLKLLETENKPSNEELQMLVNSKQIEISDNLQINNLNPIHLFAMLRVLKVNSTSISDISSIYDLKTIEILDISKNPISQLDGISQLAGLLELSLRNTSIDDLQPISRLTGLRKLDIGGTKIKSLKYITSMNDLRKLYINNTRIKSIKPLYELPDLIFLQCYNTSIKESRISDFKSSKPEVEVVYY